MPESAFRSRRNQVCSDGKKITFEVGKIIWIRTPRIACWTHPVSPCRPQRQKYTFLFVSVRRRQRCAITHALTFPWRQSTQICIKTIGLNNITFTVIFWEKWGRSNFFCKSLSSGAIIMIQPGRQRCNRWKGTLWGGIGGTSLWYFTLTRNVSELVTWVSLMMDKKKHTYVQIETKHEWNGKECAFRAEPSNHKNDYSASI